MRISDWSSDVCSSDLVPCAPAATAGGMAVSKVRASPDHEPGTRPAMNFDILIPITLFVCVAYAIKAVVDARVRRQMVESNGSEALVQSILEGEELRSRHGSLRWGIVLVALAAGFAIVQGSGGTEPNAGAFAVLLGAVGLGNLAERKSGV